MIFHDSTLLEMVRQKPRDPYRMGGPRRRHQQARPLRRRLPGGDPPVGLTPLFKATNLISSHRKRRDKKQPQYAIRPPLIDRDSASPFGSRTRSPPPPARRRRSVPASPAVPPASNSTPSPSAAARSPSARCRRRPHRPRGPDRPASPGGGRAPPARAFPAPVRPAPALPHRANRSRPWKLADSRSGRQSVVHEGFHTSTCPAHHQFEQAVVRPPDIPAAIGAHGQRQPVRAHARIDDAKQHAALRHGAPIGPQKIGGEIGLKAGASANRSITGTAGACLASTAFICPVYGPVRPKSVKRTIIGNTHNIKPCVVYLQTAKHRTYLLTSISHEQINVGTCQYEHLFNVRAT